MTINVLSGIAIPQYRHRGKELVEVRCARGRGASPSGPGVHEIGLGSAASRAQAAPESGLQGIVPCLCNSRSYRTPNGVQAIPARFSPALERSHASIVNRVSIGRSAKAAPPGIGPLAPAWERSNIADADGAASGVSGVYVFSKFLIFSPHAFKSILRPSEFERPCGRRGGFAWRGGDACAFLHVLGHSGAAVFANGARIIHRKQRRRFEAGGAGAAGQLCRPAPENSRRAARGSLGNHRSPRRGAGSSRQGPQALRRARPGGNFLPPPGAIRGAVLRQRRLPRGVRPSSYAPPITLNMLGDFCER